MKFSRSHPIKTTQFNSNHITSRKWFGSELRHRQPTAPTLQETFGSGAKKKTQKNPHWTQEETLTGWSNKQRTSHKKTGRKINMGWINSWWQIYYQQLSICKLHFHQYNLINFNTIFKHSAALRYSILSKVGGSYCPVSFIEGLFSCPTA